MKFLLLDGSVAIPSNGVVNASAILKTHGTINRQTPNFLILRDLPGILQLILLTEAGVDSIFDGCLAIKPVFNVCLIVSATEMIIQKGLFEYLGDCTGMLKYKNRNKNSRQNGRKNQRPELSFPVHAF